MKSFMFILDILISLTFMLIIACAHIKMTFMSMKQRLRNMILTVQVIEQDGMTKGETRCLGIKVSRATYSRIGRWLGRKDESV